MELKPYFMLDWDPVIFHNGKIYVLGERQEDGCLAAYGKRMSLVKLGDIVNYETLFLERSKQETEAFQKSFLEATIKKEVKENDTTKRALEENRTLSFIVREVLPALTRAYEEQEINNLLGKKADDKEKPAQAVLSDAVSDIDVRENAAIIEKLIKKVEKEYDAILQQETRQEIMPLPTDTIEDLLKEKHCNISCRPVINRRTENEIISILQEVAPGKIKAIDDCTDTSIFGSILQEPAAIFGGRVYDLIPEAGEENGVSVYLGAQRFGFQRSRQQLPDIFQKYMRLLERKLKIDALRNNGTQSAALAEAQKERAALREILQTKNYEKAGVGFLQKNGAYYVYVETPEQYALRSPHNGKYYRFKKARIAVPLITESGRIYTAKPIVLGRYAHPFTGTDVTDGQICLGDYNYENTKHLPPLESILTFLSDAKGVILQGYFDMANHRPMADLDDYHFGGHVISEEQIKKNNIPVFNKNLVKIRKDIDRRWD